MATLSAQQSLPMILRHSCPSTIILALLFLLIRIFLSPPSAWANGGTPRLMSVEAGPYSVSAWTQPNPPRMGELHISVAVMKPPSGDVVLDADVHLVVEPVGYADQRVSIKATHEAGTNALLYHNNIELPHEGLWKVTILVDGPDGRGSASFPLQVEAPPVYGWWILGIGSLAVGLALVWVAWRRHGLRGAKS